MGKIPEGGRARGYQDRVKSAMTTKAGSIPKLKGLRKTHKAVEEGKEEEGPTQRPVCMAKRLILWMMR